MSLTPWGQQLVARALHLEAMELKYEDDLNVLGWALLDHAYEATLADAMAESEECYEAVWEALFPAEDARAIVRALRRDKPWKGAS